VKFCTTHQCATVCLYPVMAATYFSRPDHERYRPTGYGAPSSLLYITSLVTSVNLNISMVTYLRRLLLCTTDCLHEQEWWILMRWSWKDVDRHLFFDKVKSLGIHCCLFEIPKNDLINEAVATGHVPRCVLLPRWNAGRLHWGKSWRYTTYLQTSLIAQFFHGDIPRPSLKRGRGRSRREDGERKGVRLCHGCRNQDCAPATYSG